MDGIHDVGGMHGFGPVEHELDEPVFHEPWEERVFGMRLSVPAAVRRPGSQRYAIERLDPVLQLRASYYERWLEAFIAGLVARGTITTAELDEQQRFYAANPTAALPRVENPKRAVAAVDRLRVRQTLHHPDAETTPRFRSGDRVRVRNIHPRGHTRLPRYVRGHSGIIERLHGVHDFPDHERPDDPIPPPQPVYNVRFAMQELWGEGAEPGHLHIDIWEPYLDPV